VDGPGSTLPVPDRPVHGGAGQGESSRRKNITDALVAIDDQILPVLKTKQYVVLKPNCVSTVALGTTNPERSWAFSTTSLRASEGRWSSPNPAAMLWQLRALGYQKIVEQHRSQNVSLVDLNIEAKYQVLPVFDYDAHVVPCAWRHGCRTPTPTSSAAR